MTAPAVVDQRTRETMMKIHAPFTPDQVQILNERQLHVDGCIPLHPMTCPNRDAGIVYDVRGVADDTQATHGTEGGLRGILIATEAGWVCPHCGYQQSWAPTAMAAHQLPIGRMFRDFPTIAQMYGVVSPEALERLITDYRRLADQGKPGAAVMAACLSQRQQALAGDTERATEAVMG